MTSNKLEELKQRAYVNKLIQPIKNELKVTGYDLTVTLEPNNGNPEVKVLFDLAFPAFSLELTEAYPDKSVEPEHFGALLGRVINSKLKTVWKDQQRVNYTVVLVDGNNLAHRAKHVYKLSYLNQDTSILYGVLRSLTTMYKKYSPYRIVVCFDAGIPAKRRELVPSYKADRHKDEAEDYQATQDQINRLYTWLPQFGFITSKLEGYEADDLLSAWSTNIKGLLQTDSQRILIVSGDKDLYQLVGPRVDVSDPMNDTLVTLDTFQTVTEVELGAWMLYRAMVGDSSDKIPGVKGIGPAFAKKILAEYPTTLQLYQAVVRRQLEPRMIELIQEAGGMKAIYATLNCINLTYFAPDRDDLFECSLLPDGVIWKEIEAELISLGFVSLANDDVFRDMVIKLSNRHGMVG